MVEIRMQVPDSLAQRLQPMHDWLPTVLELSLIGFKTPAATPTCTCCTIPVKKLSDSCRSAPRELSLLTRSPARRRNGHGEIRFQ